MSIITKEEFIALTLKGRINSWDKIIKAYCLEFGKKEEDIDIFLSALLLVPGILYECYDTAIDYFLVKFGVSILRNKDGTINNIF